MIHITVEYVFTIDDKKINHPINSVNNESVNSLITYFKL